MTKLLDSVRLSNLYLQQELQYYQNIIKNKDAGLSVREKSSLALKIEGMEREILIRAHDFESLRIVVDNISTSSVNLRKFPAIMPLKPGSYTRISSGFGRRASPTARASSNHMGIDIPASRGTPVYAPADGVVAKTRGSAGGYGKMIEMEHSFGFSTVFGHLHEIMVEPGQKIGRGKVIGLVGSTGISTGPHLHYEILKNGNKIDPISFTDIVLRKLEAE
ncbi:M23 family metallopeptidase [Parapedobacter sp. 10938]|uniref:M23 family metallopeptidase n=1 Tax=Parapedobacter flavus TaxID=3110225 RepID=UPI002DB845AA|nr:M23 family metallopeptidase [Parapedobacter sp. 10938]MEC3881820.1 M23 family metallopeptidase [Parapedobacter sp. 10938]